MSEDTQTPDATSAGSPTPTGAHPPLPNAPSWFALALRHPTQSLTLAGMLALFGWQSVETAQGGDLEEQLQAELERRESEQVLESGVGIAAQSAAQCVEDIGALRADVKDLTAVVKNRGNEQMGFLSELASYWGRSMSVLTENPPKPGPRLDEYVRKGLMRGTRDGD